MIRGLGELQRAVLEMAAQREARGWGRLYYAEILAEYFGFTVVRYGRAGSRLRDDAGQPIGGQHFDREAIGHKRYNAAQSSLSRCTRRLAERGLITCWQGTYSRWAAISLTDAGRTLVKTLPKVPQS